MSLFIGVLTFVLVLTSLFLVLVVLMQRAKSDGGMGAAMGAVAGHVRQRHSKKVWGSLILLGIILYPIQKKLSTAKTLLKL